MYNFFLHKLTHFDDLNILIVSLNTFLTRYTRVSHEDFKKKIVDPESGEMIVVQLCHFLFGNAFYEMIIVQNIASREGKKKEKKNLLVVMCTESICETGAQTNRARAH